MFMVENEVVGTSLPSVDDTATYELRLKSNAKYRRTADGAQLARDALSPPISQLKDDKELVRRKVCDSLTSALEMVVSKQLVKSVLGVVKGSNAPKVGDLSRHVLLQAQDGLLVHELIANEAEIQREAFEGDETLGMGLDFKFKSQFESEPKIVGTHPSFPSLSTGKSEDSLILNFYAEEEETSQEATCGIELVEKARRVARNVELSLFSLNRSVNRKYREKARSLLFNLKDKTNPELRAKVFAGEIKPKILVRMSAKQLAAKELSQRRTEKSKEYASMVVLSESDHNPCQIVKNIHKGEFQLVGEKTSIPASTSGASPPAIIPWNVEEDTVESKRGYRSCGMVGFLETKRKICSDVFLEKNRALGRVLTSSSFQEREEKEISAKDGTVVKNFQDLRRTYVRNGIVSDIAELSVDPNARSKDGSLDAVKFAPTVLKNEGEMLEKVLVSYPDSCVPKLSKISTTRCAESRGVASYYSEKSERVCERAVWEGSIQISATRFALINGFYESGEKLELRGWPRSVEVKGRVRLVVLDKFLQDLQLSRSRTVTILSLCPSECQGDAQQSTAYLKQLADHYCIGGRAGFVEPRPGIELYLVAPSSMPLEPPSLEDRGRMKSTRRRDRTFLFGVVVWRKCQSQGLPFSTGMNENSRPREAAISNVVHESLTQAYVTPPNCRETSSSKSWQTEDKSPSSRDWHPPFPVAIDHRAPILVSALDAVTETIDGTVTEDVSRLQSLVEVEGGVEGLPPGFLSRTVQSSQIRSETLIAESKIGVGLFEPAPVHPAGLPSHALGVAFQSPELSKDPAGVFGQSSVGMDATVEEDDDLPEFNFDLEGMVSYGTRNYLSPANISDFSSLRTHDSASPSFSRSHVASDISTSSHGDDYNVYNICPRPPRFEVLNVPGGYTLRHKTQYEKLALAATAVSTAVPTGEDWCGPPKEQGEMIPNLVRVFSSGVLPSSGKSEIKAKRRTVSTSFTAEDSNSLTPIYGIDQNIPRQRGPIEVTAREEEYDVFDYENKRTWERSVPVPRRIPLLQLPFPRQAMGKVTYEKFIPRIESHWQQAQTRAANGVLASMPPASGYYPQHSRHQVSLVHMVVQHQQSVVSSGVLSGRPRGAPWRDHQEDMITCKPSQWQQLGSVPCRYKKLDKRPLQRESCIPDGDTSAKLMRIGGEEISRRERYLHCGRGLNIRGYQKTTVDMLSAPVGAREVREEQSLMTFREPKFLTRGKRNRERDQ